MNDIQLQILQLVQAMFSASPGKHFLDEFTDSVSNGSGSVRDLAVSLAATAEFKGSRYGDALNDAQFASTFIGDMLGDLVGAENKTWAVEQIQLMLDSGMNRGAVIHDAAIALASVNVADPVWGTAAAQFNNKVEVSSHFSIEAGMSGYTLTTLRQVTEGVTSDTASVDTAKAAIGAAIQGSVADGYIAGASVFVDVDGDGVLDANEPSATSDESGNFSFPSGNVFGQIVAVGGIDIATKKPFEGALTAPAGSTVVNPLTTLIDEVASKSASVIEARQTVANVLGIDSTINLLNYDPIKESKELGASAEAKSLALKIQSIIAQLNIIVSQTAAVLNGTGVTDSETDGIKSGFAALADAFLSTASVTGATIDLTDTATISTIVKNSASKSGASASLQTTVDALANDTATIISNLANAIGDAVTTVGEDVEGNLNDIAAVQIVAEELEAGVLSGASGGTVSGIISSTTGETFTNSINTAKTQTGDVDGDGDTDAISVSGTTFTVTETSGVLTFGGTATGDITVSWDGAVGDSAATFSRGGIEAAEKPDFSSSANKLTLASGQNLVLSLADLTTLNTAVIRIEGDGVVKLTDTAITVRFLNTADFLTTAVIDASRGTTLGGTASEILTAINSEKIILASNFAATVTGTPSTAEIQTIDDATTGVISATVSETLEGVVVDGYVSGATVFIDIDGDGVQDANEPSTTTDSKGNFSFGDEVKAYGPIVAIGGTDIATGKPFEGALTAPAGSTVVNPLTTLIDKITKSGGTVAAAKETVNKALGIDNNTDLLKFDPLKQSTDANASAVTKALALKLQAAAAQVNTIVSQSAAVLTGAGASSSEDSGISSAYSALAESFKTAASTGTIDLKAPETISTVVKSAATLSGATAEQQTSVDTLANDAATVITNLTKAIDDAVTTNGDDAIATLNKIASIQVVAEDLEAQLTTGATGGSLTDSVTSTTGDTLTTSVTDAESEIGDVDGDGVSNATTTTTTTPTTFTVTETGGAVTFGGNATGNITAAWDGTVGNSVATFARGGISASVKPDFSGTANKITVASGQVYSLSLSDLTAIAVTASKAIDGAGSVKLTDTTVAVATLNTADGSTTAKIDASTATTITGTAANLATAIGSAGLTLPDGYAATISGTPSVSNLNTIDGDTTGVVTATLGSDTLANLNALSGTGNAYTMTVTDASVAAATLNTLDGKTTATVTVNASTITGTSADILTALNSSGLSTSGSINATVNSGTPTISNLNSIRGKTTGTITATLSDTAANLATLTANANNAYTLTVSDASVTAANLKTIDAATSVAVNTNSNVTTISGSAADIKTVAEASGITKPSSYTASVTDSGSWSTTAATVNNVTVNSGSLTVDASADAAVTLAGSANMTVTGLINALTATSVSGTLAVTAASDTAMSVATGSGTNTITATALTDGQVLTVTGDDAATITLAGGDLTASGSSGALTITAGTGTSVITGGSGADTITGGAGADSITPGSGADTVKWTASSSSAMATESGAATGDTDFSAATAGDQISGFVSGSDKLQFSAALLSNASGTQTDTLVSIASGGVVPNTARFVEVTTSITETTGDAITLLNGLDTSAVAIGDSFIAFVRGATNGYLYLIKQVSTSNTIAAQDVTLIGQLAGVTDIANGDLTSAASVTATVNPASTLTISGDPAGLVEVDLTQATAGNVVKQNSEAVTVTETATYNQASITTLAASSLTGSSGINVTIQASDAGDLATFTAPSSGTATLVLSDGGNYASQSVTNFDQVNLASGISVTLTTAAANKINSAAGTNTVTISDTSTSITAKAAIENYTLSGSGANTITLAGSAQNVTTAANASAQTIKTGSLTSYTGTITGNSTDTSTVLTIDTNNTDISGATLNIGSSTGVDVLAQGTNGVTVSSAQHDSLIGVSATAAITGTGTITIDTPDTTITADASPSAYILTGAGANTITLAASAQNVTTAAHASAQEIKTGSLTTYTGTITGNSTDTSTILTIDTNNTDVSGATLNIGANSGIDVLAQGTNGVTVSSAQHDSLIGVSATAAITGTGTITIDTADTTITADASPGAYILTGAGANTITLAASGQSVTTAANASAQEIKTGSLTTYTGTITGNATDTSTTLTIDTNNTDISGATLNIGANTGVDVLAQGTNGVTVSSAQHDSLIGVSATAAITGTGTITIDTADTTITADASPGTYILTGAGANTITIAASAQNVTTAAHASAQEIKTGSLTTYTGTITGNATDTSTTLTIDTNNTDISGATLNIGSSSGVDVLAQGTNGVTVSSAQHDSLIGVSATAAITGTGTITIDTADTTITADASPSAYVLTGAGANTITLGAAGQNITTAAHASNQTVQLGSLTSFTGTFTGNGTATDILNIATTGTNISSGTLTSVEALTLGSGISVTMTPSQNNGFSGTITAAGSETINITGDGSVTTLSNIETYSVADDSTNTRSITVSAAGTSVTANSSTDAVTFGLGSLTYTGTVTGEGTVDDILSLGTGANITGGTISNVEALTLASGASVTMTRGQHAAFTGTVTAPGSETINITGDGALTTFSAVETYSVGDDSTNSRTITVSAAGTSVTANSGTDAVTFGLGTLTYTGTVTGEGTTDDILSLGTGANITGGTISNVEALTLASGASVTMTRGQHAAFTGTVTAPGSETINITGDGALTTFSAVETYSVGDDSTNSRTITVSAAGTSVTANSGTDAVTFGLGTLTYTGTVTGEGTVDDILSLGTGANITGGTISNVEALTLASGASVTMTRAQNAAFTGTITAPGSETINITGDGAVTTLANVETYSVGDDSTNSRTITVSAAGTSVTANSGTDAVTFGLGTLTYTGTVTGEGTVDDILSLGTGANITGGTITNVEALTLASGASVTMTRGQHAAFTGTVTAPGSETINITGDGAVTTFSAVETYSVGDDSTNSRTITVSAAGTSVTANSSTDAVTFGLGTLTYTGTVTGEGTVDDILSLGTGASISGGTITNVEALTLASGASVTMTASQNNAFTGTITAAGSETINITGDGAVTTLANIETYSVGDDSTNSRTITVSAAGTSATANSGTDAVTFGLGTLTYTGTVTGEGTVDDILSLGNGANITGGTISNIEALTLASGASVTMTRAQNAAFTGTITAPGSETINITGDGAVTTLANVETYSVGDDSTNSRTITVSAGGTSVTANSGTDAVTFGLGTLTYTGTVTGEGTAADTLSLGNGADIDAGTITNVINLTLADNASVTMSRAQHAAFSGTITAGASETINITGDGSVTTFSAVETYSVGDDSTNSRTITVSAAGTSVTASSGTDAVTFGLGTLTYTGTVTGDATTDDILSLGTGANITGGTITNVEALTLASGASVTMTAAQNNAFTGTITAAGSETINITGDGAVTTLANVETYSVGDDSTNSRTITVSAAGTSVTANSGTDAVTFGLGTLTYTGTVTGDATTDDILSLGTGANITGGTITNVEALTLDSGASVTMTRAQHAAFTGTVTAAGSETINITGDGSVTTFSAVETYSVGDDSTNSRTITVSAAGTSVTASSGTDAVTFGLGTLTYTGTVTGDATTDDILSLGTGASISGGTITNVEALTLASGASVTMTRAQHAAFTGTITAAGSETINITGDGSVTTFSAVETYSVGDDSTNSRSITVSAAGTSVTANSGTDAVTFDLGTLTYTGTVTGEGTVDDILSLGTGANITGGTITNVEALTLASGASVTMTRAQHAAFTGTVTAAGSETINITGDGSVTTFSAVETYSIGDDSTDTRSVTVSAAGTSVTASSTSDAVTFDLGTLTYTGTVTGDATTDDILSLGNGADISGGTITNIEALTLASGASVTMTASQYTGFTGTVTAAGSETIVFSDAITGAATLNAAVENWTLAAGTNSVTTGTANQSINADALTDAQVLTLAGSVTTSVSLVNGDLSAGSYTGAITVTATTGTNVITTGTGNDIITGGAGVNAITTGNGTDTVNLLTPGSLNATANADTVSDFTTTSDKLSFDGITVTGGGAITATTGTAVTAGGVTAGALTDDTVYVINNGGTALTSGGVETIASYTDLADVAAYLGEGYTSTADNDAAIFVINNGAGTAYVYLFDEQTAGADTITSTDLALIGTITEAGSGALVAGDIA